MQRWLLAGLLCALPAFAHGVSDELIVNSSQQSPGNPRSGSVGDVLNGTFDLSSDWLLSAGVTLTREGETPAAAKGQFGSSSSTVLLFNGGIDWLGEHWSAGASFGFSPQATLSAGTSFNAPNRNGTQVPVNALVESQTSEVLGGLDFAWDSAGDSGLEWNFGGGVTFTHLGTDQRITEGRYTDDGALLTAAQIRARCERSNAVLCVPAVLKALDETPANLDSERFDIDATAIVETDTDLRLAASIYHYEEDPAAVGFFSLAETGRAGLGVPIAPLQFLVKPEVTHRFGDLSLRLWLEAGRYEPGTGEGTAGVGARLQYKLSKTFRIWISLMGRRDTDVDGNDLQSGSASLGAALRF